MEIKQVKRAVIIFGLLLTITSGCAISITRNTYYGNVNEVKKTQQKENKQVQITKAGTNNK